MVEKIDITTPASESNINTGESNIIPDIRRYLISMPSDPDKAEQRYLDWSENSRDPIASMFKRESKYLRGEIEVVQERIKNLDPSIPKKSKHSNNPLSLRVKRDIEKHKKETRDSLDSRLNSLVYRLGIVEGIDLRPVALIGEDDDHIVGFKI